MAATNPQTAAIGKALAAAMTKKKKPKAASTKFIQGAIKRPGALTAKAKAAGMTIDAFARAHAKDTGVTGDESRFYLNVLSKRGR